MIDKSCEFHFRRVKSYHANLACCTHLLCLLSEIKVSNFIDKVQLIIHKRSKCTHFNLQSFSNSNPNTALRSFLEQKSEL